MVNAAFAYCGTRYAYLSQPPAAPLIGGAHVAYLFSR